MNLPELIDGTDIFLREGEVISKVKFIHNPDKCWYISNLSPVKYRGSQEYVLCFRMGDHPNCRMTQYINKDQLIYD